MQGDSWGAWSRDRFGNRSSSCHDARLVEVAGTLRLLSDGSISTLGERERLLLGRALVELESVAGQTRPACSSSEALVGPVCLEGLGPLLSRVIADSGELAVTLTLLRCRDLIEAATGR